MAKKKNLTEAGIDIFIFSSHSTKHTATSYGNLQGVSIEMIFQSSGWTNNSSAFLLPSYVIILDLPQLSIKRSVKNSFSKVNYFEF